jgi:hypothetical protein
MSDQDEQASHALALHHRAEELRGVAQTLKDRDCHDALLRLAASYELMARGAEAALESEEKKPSAATS